MGKSEAVKVDSGQKKTRKVRTVPLTRGLVALIDDQDTDTVAWDKWHASVSLGRAYAVRRAAVGEGARRVVYMHRLIMGAPEGATVDHINGDTLDNRRCNLRVCTQAENVRNRAKSRTRRSSAYLGVYHALNIGKWRAVIRVNGKQRHLGCFADEAEAARAYDAAALAHHGQFARLNFPSGPTTALVIPLVKIDGPSLPSPSGPTPW